MARYREKSREYDAVTYDEFVEYGRQQLGQVLGLPMRFTYGWYPCTYDERRCAYTIVCEKGIVVFSMGEMLIVSECGIIFSLTKEKFDLNFEAVVE